MDRLAGRWRTARAHGARGRPPRSGARQCGGTARRAPRVVYESDHRARRRAHRIGVDRRGTAVSGGRAGADAPSGRPRAICCSRGTARCWRWPSTSSTGMPLGTATPIMPAGAIEPISSGQVGLSLSSTGTLLSTPAGFTDTRVVSVGRDGAALALDLPSGRYAIPRISPDGRRLLVDSGENIEALDLARGTRARLASATQSTVFSEWSADGKRVVFRRFASLFWVASDGSGVTASVPGGHRATTSPRHRDPIRTPLSPSASGRRPRGTSF